MSAYDLIIANLLLYVCVCAWVGVCLTEKRKGGREKWLGFGGVDAPVCIRNH